MEDCKCYEWKMHFLALNMDKDDLKDPSCEKADNTLHYRSSFLTISSTNSLVCCGLDLWAKQYSLQNKPDNTAYACLAARISHSHWMEYTKCGDKRLFFVHQLVDNVECTARPMAPLKQTWHSMSYQWPPHYSAICLHPFFDVFRNDRKWNCTARI